MPNPTRRLAIPVGAATLAVLAGGIVTAATKTGDHPSPRSPVAKAASPAASHAVSTEPVPTAAASSSPARFALVARSPRIVLPTDALLGLPRDHRADSVDAALHDAANAAGDVVFQYALYQGDTGLINVAAGSVKAGRTLPLGAYEAGLRYSASRGGTTYGSFQSVAPGAQGGQMQCATVTVERIAAPVHECVWTDGITAGDVTYIGRSDAATITRHVRAAIEVP